MKLATIKHNQTILYGEVTDTGFIAVEGEFQQQYPSLRNLLENNATEQLVSHIQTLSSQLSLDEIEWLPPIPDPPRIFCVGINYPKKYPLDNPAPPPEQIILFAKLDGTLVGHEVPLEIPEGDAAASFDYEGEIGVIIGKAGRHISETDAMEYIAGYTIVNDGSVRDWQKHSIHAGKNFANSGGYGPWMVTADEIDDLASMRLSTRLNGETVQDTTAADMVFSIPQVIAYISHTIDLRPGDLIATGSPEGAGGSRVPPRFLREADLLEIEVSGVGLLRNRVG